MIPDPSKIIYMIILLVIVHFIADFLFQSDKMAINKSISFLWLSIHSMVYTMCFMMVLPWTGIVFILVNGVSHLLVDFCTSKITSYLWKKEKRHWFFVTIGFDQAIHLSILLLTLLILVL